LDSTKAKTHLGWRPILELPTAIEWIVDWYRAFAAGQDLRALTEKQIRDYEARLATANDRP
jgi:CDP-glucose 4,6-dehydratase